MIVFNTRLTRLLQPDSERQLISWLFLRSLAVIYLIAFTSLASQITGLVGEQGILPLTEHYLHASQHLGVRAWWWFPSLFWLTGSSDAALQGAALLGVMVSLILLVGRWERLALVILFLLYLSLYHAGQVFTNFQWDSLLLEAGFLSLFLVGGPNYLLIFLFDWLLFRLRFMSGLFKLLSNDPSWSGFTALNHYFETQPLPHIGAWYAHQLPEWLLKAGVGLTLFSELIVPFFIFLPRHFRRFAAGITITMQLLIIATSNHNFINLLTIALCLFLLDDRLLESRLPKAIKARVRNFTPPSGKINNIMIIMAFFLIVPTSLIGLADKLWHLPLIDKVTPWSESVQRFGIGQLFHIFPTMQVQRHELIIQGSNDGRIWQTYEFKYKPGNPAKPPRFNVPHQPRLDWMLWFAPTQHPVHMAWFNQFMKKLQQGAPNAIGLLANNPFPVAPPRYLRVLVYRYTFMNWQEKSKSSDWWRMEYLGEFPRVEPRRP
jgi:hypothetical protein